MSTPKTIQIFLPSGDPQGVRIAEITTRIIRVIEIPRSRLSDFLQMPESKQVGVYFLFGESDESGVAEAYVGQSGGVGQRLITHNKEKDFWRHALVAVSLTNNFTSTHGSYLEWLSIDQAAKAGRYELVNGNGGAKPHTPPPLEADCTEVHETVRVLLATLGFPLFESLTKPVSETSVDEYFYCKASGADGRGLYTEEGFVVLKGSSGRNETVPSAEGKWAGKIRVRLQEQGIMTAEDGRVVFERDHLFKSPSGAAASLAGRPANGWIEWKNAYGQTLDELKRQL